jgi:hypothetical protein
MRSEVKKRRYDTMLVKGADTAVIKARCRPIVPQVYHARRRRGQQGKRSIDSNESHA